jgi:hypothetical protein
MWLSLSCVELCLSGYIMDRSRNCWWPHCFWPTSESKGLHRSSTGRYQTIHSSFKNYMCIAILNKQNCLLFFSKNENKKVEQEVLSGALAPVRGGRI